MVLGKIQMGVIIAVFVGILSLLGVSYFQTKEYKSEIVELRLEVADTVLKLSHAEANSVTLRGAIAMQNDEISKWKVERDNTVEAYNELLQKPEAVRFKTKYVEVQSDDCKDIKLILDDIRTNGF